jgi:hypothetical protein
VEEDSLEGARSEGKGSRNGGLKVEEEEGDEKWSGVEKRRKDRDKKDKEDEQDE